MNQTFNKKALTAGVAAALASTGAAYANVFADSTANSPTAVIAVKGGALVKTPAVTLTELGTYASGNANPVGVRITIPAGLTVYGAKVSQSGVYASNLNSVASCDASALALTTGTTYALRLAFPTITDKGDLSAGAFVVIDANASSPNAANTSPSSTLWDYNGGASSVYALFSASTVGYNEAFNSTNVSGNVANGFNVSAGGLASLSLTASNATNAFGSAAFAPSASAGSTGMQLRRADGSYPNKIGQPVGSLTANSDGTMTMVLYTASNNSVSSTDALVVPPLVVGVGSASTASGSLALTVTDGPSASQTGSSNLVGVTNTSVNVLTVATSGIALGKKTSTNVIPVDVQGLANQSVDPIKVTFATPVTQAQKNKVTLTLDNGAKFVSGAAWTGNIMTAAANDFFTGLAASTAATMFNSNTYGSNPFTYSQIAANCTGSDTNTAVNCTSGILSNNNATLTMTLDNEAVAASDGFVVQGTLLDLTSAGTGAVNLTVASGTSTASIQVASVAAKGATVAYVDNSPTGYTTYYSGRSGVTVVDGVSITESAAGSLSLNGAISLTASNGALFTNTSLTPTVAKVDTSSTSSAGTLSTFGVTGTASAALSGSVSGVSSTAEKVTFSGFTMDLTSATAGDLTVTVAGGAGASGSVKIATIANATTVSASGTMAVGSASGIATLPDLVITETAAGAITNGTGKYVAIAAPISQVSAFDVTGATVKAYDASGADISTSLFSAASTTLTAGSVSGSTAYATFITTNASSVPATIKVSGLKASLASTATGDISLTMGGNASGAPDLSAASTSTALISSDKGSQITKLTVKAGSVVPAAVGYYPEATVTGSSITSQNISVGMVPAGNDQSKQGSVFVAAVVTAPGISGVYFMDSASTWTLYTDCAKAAVYSTGSLAQVSGVKLLPAATDLTGLKGTDIYIGYGVGGALSPAGTACNNMLSGGTYSKVYSIK